MIKGILVRDANGGFTVFINDQELSPKESQELRNHSPDGFAWGYGGSGPAQLALALLLKFTTKEKALKYYQQFKWDIISGLPGSGFELLEEVVTNWIKKREASDENTK